MIRLHFTDAAVFADELAAYGPEVRVLAPAALRDAVRERLARGGRRPPRRSVAERGRRHDGQAFASR